MVAKKRRSWQAPQKTLVATPSGPAGVAAPPVKGRAPPGRPPIRGVIVLTVKLFGETLKAPRT